MSFISEIDDFTIYKLKRDLNLGSIVLNQNDCVCLVVKNVNGTKIVSIKRYNKQTQSFLTVSLPEGFTYKKYFIVDEESTDKFVESMSEFDKLYYKVNDMKSFTKTAFGFTVIMVSMTILAMLCNASDYLHAISGDESMKAFTYLSIFCGAGAFIASVITAFAIYRHGKLDKMYDSYYDKRLRKLLKKLQ